MERTGPSPLSVYIGLAAAAWPQEGLTNMSEEGVSSSEDFPDHLRKMLLGIQQYQKHPYHPPQLPYHVIWQEGTVCLKSVPGHDYKKSNRAIVLVPSMINRAYVLDLLPQRSMLRWFGEQGFNPYLLDWGDLIEGEGQSELSVVIQKRLIPAFQFLNEYYGAPVHTLGYCMGGTVLVGAASYAPELMASMTMLAAPWDFHSGTQALLNRVKFWAPTAFPMIQEKGELSVDWIQTMFATLDPEMAAKKFSGFADMDQDSEKAQIFIAIEDWLNDGTSLPAGIATTCIRDWFLKNDTYEGRWKVGRRYVRPSRIDVPTLIIASTKDRLVEYDVAAALKEQMPSAAVVNPACGHIGMIAGGGAVEKVWEPIANWIISLH